MAKKGMKRPEFSEDKGTAASVPQIQGKAKSGKEHARPIIAGTQSPSMKVYHTRPFSYREDDYEREIGSVYPEIDNDLARDNVENDLTYADLQDF